VSPPTMRGPHVGRALARGENARLAAVVPRIVEEGHPLRSDW